MEPERFQPLSTAEAVVRYAGDFLPSWAGAISIDLMPAVLVLIFCIVHAQIRRENEPNLADNMTASQLLTALRIARDIRRAHREVDAPLQPVAQDLEEKVTTLNTARARKNDREQCTRLILALAWRHARRRRAALALPRLDRRNFGSGSARLR